MICPKSLSPPLLLCLPFLLPLPSFVLFSPLFGSKVISVKLFSHHFQLKALLYRLYFQNLSFFMLILYSWVNARVSQMFSEFMN